jgi:hypothetical protein
MISFLSRIFGSNYPHSITSFVLSESIKPAIHGIFKTQSAHHDEKIVEVFGLVDQLDVSCADLKFIIVR